jgi:hypothetical protein
MNIALFTYLMHVEFFTALKSWVEVACLIMDQHLTRMNNAEKNYFRAQEPDARLFPANE